MTLLVQLTDTHILEPGKLLYDKVDTADHLAQAVRQVNAMDPQPDVVMITGDLVEQPGPKTYQNFADLIKPLKAPVYILLGNHDNPDALKAQFNGSSIFPAIGPHYQYAIEDFSFRILALNSHYDGSELPYFGPKRLAWLEQALAESDRPTLIAIHHPPMVTGIEFVDMVGAQWYDGIRALIRKNPQVKLVICGHAHTDLVGRIEQATVYMAGSTAHQLIAGRGNDHAPSFDYRPTPPILHHWVGGGFVSGSCPWPSWVEESRIDKVSGLDWEVLKDHMRGKMR